jgi:hypothetical protein
MRKKLQKSEYLYLIDTLIEKTATRAIDWEVNTKNPEGFIFRSKNCEIYINKVVRANMLTINVIYGNYDFVLCVTEFASAGILDELYNHIMHCYYVDERQNNSLKEVIKEIEKY